MSTKENLPEWQKAVIEESGAKSYSAMDLVPVIKVYNKPMDKNTPSDPEKEGKILIKNPGSLEWVVLGEELKLNILAVRKTYTGFAPRLNEFGDAAKDENGNVIKDFYFTPEVEVFNKDNIPLAKLCKGMGIEIIGKDTKLNFDQFIKVPTIGNKPNPLFKGVQTNDRTGERYAQTYLKLTYVIYAENLATGDVYKIIPGGSYGRFNDIMPGTFEDLRAQANKEYRENYNDRCMDSFIETKVTVRYDGKYYFFDWKLAGFCVKDNRPQVEEIKQVIDEFNKVRFEGVDFNKPMESLPYSSVLLLNTPTKGEDVKVSEKTIKDAAIDGEVSIDDVPF